MGTYTANKELYMPTVGETGWGTLMNGNLETIDNFLKPITVSGSTYTFTGNQTGGTITATKITNSGTLTNTGKITANGGIGTTTLTASSTSTFTGKITANGGIGTKALTATSISNSGNMTNTGTLTSTGKITGNGGIAGTTGTFSGRVVSSNLCTLPMLRVVPISEAIFSDNKPIHSWSAAGGTGSVTTMNTYLTTGVTATFNVETLFSHWETSGYDWFVTGATADSAVSVLIGASHCNVTITCNGTTTTIENNTTITTTIARLNEFIRYPSTITMTATANNPSIWCGFTKTNTSSYCVVAN